MAHPYEELEDEELIEKCNEAHAALYRTLSKKQRQLFEDWRDLEDEIAERDLIG